MATGRLVSVDFETPEPDEMLLHIATPSGGVVHGEVFWCMEDHTGSEILRLRAALRELRDYCSSHHADQQPCEYLHALTVDVPHMIDNTLDRR